MNAGWDTDQFLTDIAEATMVMLSVVRNVCQLVADDFSSTFFFGGLKNINWYYLFFIDREGWPLEDSTLMPNCKFLSFLFIWTLFL